MNWKRHKDSILALLCCLVLNYFAKQIPRREIVFFEQNLNNSFPLMPQTVSMTVLSVLAVFIPIPVIIYCIHCGFKHWGCKQDTILSLLIYFFITLSVTLILTDGIKPIIGEARPNAFAMCNYMYYNDLLSSGGDMKSYQSSTVFGAIGDYSKCKSGVDMINDAFSSMPSGHASFIFASMHFAGLLLFLLHREYYTGEGCSVSSLIGFDCCALSLPLLLAVCVYAIAIFVAISRVFDYYHHIWDVLAGVVLGAGVAQAVWCNVVIPSLQANLTYRPLDTRKDVELSIV